MAAGSAARLSTEEVGRAMIIAAGNAASRTGGKPARAHRCARRAGTAKNIMGGSAARLSTAQVGKAENTAAGNAAPPVGGSAGHARAATRQELFSDNK